MEATDNTNRGTRGKTILIAEDDQVVSTLYQRRLSQEGYQVAVAPSGSEAFRRLYFETYDLVLLDLMLPDKDGLEVLRLIRQTEKHAATRVIILSGVNLSVAREAAKQLGVRRFLVKDKARAEEVLRAVQDELARAEEGEASGGMRMATPTPLEDPNPKRIKRPEPPPPLPPEPERKGLLNKLFRKE